MSDTQDWKPVVFRSKKKKALSQSQAHHPGKSIEVTKKYNAGKNSQSSQSLSKKLIEDEIPVVKTVSKTTAKLVQQARLAKKLTQAQLAAKVNEKKQVIADVESGRHKRDEKLLIKLERALGTKLRTRPK